MWSTVSASALEAWVEQIRTMTPTWNSVVDNQLDYNIQSSFLSVGDVLTIRALKLAELCETTRHSCPIRAVVTRLAFGALV
jgi:hypothetical protein